MPERATIEREELERAIKLRSLFSLSFGTIIGVGWVTVLGSWLTDAGSVGAMVGFLGGGLAMAVIGLVYAEAATMYPVSGGEVAYVYEMYGTKTAFAAGWFLAFGYIAVTSFEAVSVGWVASALFPGLRGPAIYTVLGEEVHLGSLLLGVVVMAAIAAINYRGAKNTAAFQDVMTFGLLFASLVFIGAGLVAGDRGNLEPAFVGEGAGSATLGILAVFATAPFWFAGFDTIPQAMGEVESGARLRLIPRVILLAIAVASVFYCLVILTASVSLPRDELLDLDLPVAGAIEAALDSALLGKVVLLAGLCGLITTWNAIFFAATRLVFSIGRGHMIPHHFAKVHTTFGSPAIAILFVAAIGVVGAFFGRQAISPIVNANATCLAFVFFLVCLGVGKLRKRLPQHPRPFRVPGGRLLPYLGAVLALAMLYLSLYEPYANRSGAVPSEWIVLAIWAVLGRLFWGMAARVRDEVSEEDRRWLVTGRVDAAVALPGRRRGATRERPRSSNGNRRKPQS